MLGDRVSRKLLVLTSLIGWSAATALSGAAESLTMLAVLRVVFGVFLCIYLPSAAALQAGHHGPETRTFAMGLNKLAQSGGVVLGAAGVGLVAEHWGWRPAFWVTGLAGIALALASPCLLSEAPGSAAAARLPWSKIGRTLADLGRNGTFLMLVANEFFSGVAVWVFLYWLPLYLFETYHLKLAAAGSSGMAMLQITSMLGSLAGTWLVRRLPRLGAPRRMFLFAVSTLAAAPCLLCFLAHPTYLIVTVAVSAYSLLRGFGGIFELPILCEVVPPSQQSTAIGLLVAGAFSPD
jgi:MFS family permease